MAKLSANMTEKLKNMARGLKEETPAAGIKGVADKIKQQSQAHKKQSTDGGKLSGRKG